MAEVPKARNLAAVIAIGCLLAAGCSKAGTPGSGTPPPASPAAAAASPSGPPAPPAAPAAQMQATTTVHKRPQAPSTRQGGASLPERDPLAGVAPGGEPASVQVGRDQGGEGRDGQGGDHDPGRDHHDLPPPAGSPPCP